MYIRSFTWGRADLSWSVVMDELTHAAEELNHDVSLISTNGYSGMRYWTEEKSKSQDLKIRSMIKNNGFDLDITYTVPENFNKRFLSSSKIKAAIYAFESSEMPEVWKRYYHHVDYIFPPSEYVANMFRHNGCPSNKIVVVPHGVDLNIFNPEVKPYDKIKTDKKFKFLTISEPHYRKQLDKLLHVYAKTFTSKDDVTLILKTKIFDKETIKERQGFEQDIRPVLLDLKKKYGKSLPEIKIMNKRIPDIASLYTFADAFALMTASEGWGMPFLESLACGIPVIAPRHGGQLQFLNNSNSLLTKTGRRVARRSEEYWGGSRTNKKAYVGDPDEKDFSNKMMTMYKNHKQIKSQLMPGMLETANKFTWKNAFSVIEDTIK